LVALLALTARESGLSKSSAGRMASSSPQLSDGDDGGDDEAPPAAAGSCPRCRPTAYPPCRDAQQHLIHDMWRGRNAGHSCGIGEAPPSYWLSHMAEHAGWARTVRPCGGGSSSYLRQTAVLLRRRGWYMAGTAAQ
jgi:hypothetical protein